MSKKKRRKNPLRAAKSAKTKTTSNADDVARRAGKASFPAAEYDAFASRSDLDEAKLETWEPTKVDEENNLISEKEAVELMEETKDEITAKEEKGELKTDELVGEDADKEEIGYEETKLDEESESNSKNTSDSPKGEKEAPAIVKSKKRRNQKNKRKNKGQKTVKAKTQILNDLG